MDFKLREFKHEDTQSFFEHSNNMLIHDNMRDGFPSTLGGCATLVSSYVNMGEECGIVRAIDIDGKVAGSIGLFLQEGGYSAEIAFWLGELYWGRGIAFKAVQAISAYGFEQFKLARIYSEPFAGNMRARRILEKCDFKLEGILKRAYRKSGKLVDYCVYALLADM